MKLREPKSQEHDGWDSEAEHRKLVGVRVCGRVTGRLNICINVSRAWRQSCRRGGMRRRQRKEGRVGLMETPCCEGSNSLLLRRPVRKPGGQMGRALDQRRRPTGKPAHSQRAAFQLRSPPPSHFLYMRNSAKLTPPKFSHKIVSLSCR